MTSPSRRRLATLAVAGLVLAGCASGEARPASAPGSRAATSEASSAQRSPSDEHEGHHATAPSDDSTQTPTSETPTELFGTPVPDGAHAHDHGDVEMAALPDSDVPARLRIPAIGVDAPTIDLGLEADGSMAVPDDWDVTSWFTHSPTPGELGASVILGHVDSQSGPAVFYRLKELTAGAEIVVTDAVGADHRFVVDEVAQYPKDGLPTEQVFGYVREPVLRLVTCGGDFDPGRGHYTDNVVVYASLA